MVSPSRAATIAARIRPSRSATLGSLGLVPLDGCRNRGDDEGFERLALLDRGHSGVDVQVFGQIHVEPCHAPKLTLFRDRAGINECPGVAK
jgi:hypothetical protein